MKYRIIGADRDTGDDVELVVSADSAAAAMAIGNAKGILIAEVTEVPGASQATTEGQRNHASPGAKSEATAKGLPDAWYYVDGDTRMGPFAAQKLRDLHATRDIGAGTLVWMEGMPEWVSFDQSGLLPPRAEGIKPKFDGYYYITGTSSAGESMWSVIEAEDESHAQLAACEAGILPETCTFRKGPIPPEYGGPTATAPPGDVGHSPPGSASPLSPSRSGGMNARQKRNLAMVGGFIIGVLVTNWILSDKKSSPIRMIIEGHQLQSEIESTYGEAQKVVDQSPGGTKEERAAKDIVGSSLGAEKSCLSCCISVPVGMMGAVLLFGGAVGAGIAGSIASRGANRS